jgi:hypothetical protein
MCGLRLVYSWSGRRSGILLRSLSEAGSCAFSLYLVKVQHHVGSFRAVLAKTSRATSDITMMNAATPAAG